MPRLTAHARRALVEERRQQILTAAAAVFADKGFDRATIRDVARAAGIADGSIYNYFRDKQDLLVHLPHQFIRPPIEALRAASSADQSLAPEMLLQSMAQNIVNVMTQNRELARVLFTSVPLMDEDLRAEYMRQVPLYAFEALEKYITTQQAAGVFRADLDAAIAARAFPGMMLFFLLVQELLQPPNLPRFEYAEVLPQVVEIFLRGVTASGPTPSALAQKTVSKRNAPARQLRTQKPPARIKRKHRIAVK
jgi:TetR/AcrR family transcriptional repressor of mexJK operon